MSHLPFFWNLDEETVIINRVSSFLVVPYIVLVLLMNFTLDTYFSTLPIMYLADPIASSSSVFN